MLHTSFITPIDRADIHRISSRIDDIMDHIEATVAARLAVRNRRADAGGPRDGRASRRRDEAMKAAVDALAARREPGAIRKLCVAT